MLVRLVWVRCLWHPVSLHLPTSDFCAFPCISPAADDDSWAAEVFDDCPAGTNAVTWAPAFHVGGRIEGAHTEGAGGIVRRLATAGCDHHIRIHRRVGPSAPAGASRWERENELAGHSGWVRDVAWAPASGLGLNMLASCSDDGSVLIWRQAAAGEEWHAEALPTFPAPVWRVSWSVTGNVLAVSCGDNSVTLWKENLAGKWQQVSTVPDPAGPEGMPTSSMSAAAHASAAPVASAGYAPGHHGAGVAASQYGAVQQQPQQQVAAAPAYSGYGAHQQTAPVAHHHGHQQPQAHGGHPGYGMQHQGGYPQAGGYGGGYGAY